jgi:monoamine oxidase
MRDPEDDNDDLAEILRGLDRRKFGKILVGGVGGLTLGTSAWAEECESSQCIKDSKSLTNSPTTPNLYPQEHNFQPFRDEGVQVDVVIVGAGLSGLIAARELKKAGKTVIVLEGSFRIGGRMRGRTPTGFDEGYLDFGGQWVGPTQTHMLELLSELGIKKFDSYETGRSIQSWDGRKSAFDGDVSNLLKGCTPPSVFPPSPASARCTSTEPLLNFKDCVHNECHGVVWNALLEISKNVPRDKPWETQGTVITTQCPKGYDEITFQEWLEQFQPNDVVDYRKWLSVLQSHIGGSGGFEPDKVSLLHMAWTQKVGPQADTPEKWLLVGGAGQIPPILADDLIKDGPQCRIVLNALVDVIQIDNNVNVFVKTTNPPPVSRKAKVIARAAIIAIPPPLRANIEFRFASSGLSPAATANTQFGKCSPMGSMSKVHAVYETAFWRDDCLSGSTAGNLQDLKAAGFPRYCEFIADSSPPPDAQGMSRPGILTSFIASDRNRELTRNLPNLPGQTDDEKVRNVVLEDFAYYFGPRAKDLKKLKDFVYQPWDAQKGICGAFTSHLGPGVWTRYGKDGWRKPVNDKIFWAGTETSDEWPGYFDGAVKAGKVAAKDICKAFKWACPG